ncbi:hypothetical protein ACMATS_05870 [Streptoverticillium reticulum]|uniref:hypothetical protein n=1 Tax=Streptoverticillium reticulum TaxID=1433415 RepID=UPI0039BFE7E8
MGRLVSFNEAEAAWLLESPGGPVYRHVEQIMLNTAQAAVALAPHASGRTARSLHRRMSVQRGRRVTGTVFSTNPVVRYLEEGTGLYGPRRRIIRSRSGKRMGPIRRPYPRFLRQQKGMRPQPFLRRALELASPYPVAGPGASSGSA